jgi:hypothetical protein
MRSYRAELINHQREEELKDYFASKRIHKALKGQLKPSDSEIIERLRKESKRYAN